MPAYNKVRLKSASIRVRPSLGTETKKKNQKGIGVGIAKIGNIPLLYTRRNK